MLIGGLQSIQERVSAVPYGSSCLLDKEHAKSLRRRRYESAPISVAASRLMGLRLDECRHPHGLLCHSGASHGDGYLRVPEVPSPAPQRFRDDSPVLWLDSCGSPLGAGTCAAILSDSTSDRVTRLGCLACERLQEPHRDPRPRRRAIPSVLVDADLDNLDHLAMGAPPEGPCPLGGPFRSLCPTLLRLW